MAENDKREELKKTLRKAVALLGDISEKIDEVTSALSFALSIVGYREGASIPEGVVVAGAKGSPPVPITFKKKEDRVAEVSKVVARPVDSRFKTLEELVPEGTHIKAMVSELDEVRDWIMGISPTQSTVMYQINQWSRILKNYPYQKLTERDGGELMFSIHEWKTRLSKMS
ncbi:MAG: hypothetical protein WED07_02535 [Candidatus Freyarchaeum deiterrae]